MVKKSLIWLYSATTYLLWAVVIVVASVVLAFRYYVLPHANDYRDAIARHVSQAIGERVVIGNIEAGWDGLYPYLDLYKIGIYDAQGRPALQLDHVETSLSWLSLVMGELRLAKLVVRQPNLLIHRAQDGTVYVAGISMSGPTRPELPNWLLRQSSITVDNATVVWQDDLRKAPPLALNKLSMYISSPPWQSLLGHHRFGLQATPSAGTSAPIDLRGSVWGKNVDNLNQWHGTLYAKLEGTDLAGWRAWVDYPFDLVKGFGATQVWLDFAKGQAQKITSDVLLTNVLIRFGNNAPDTDLQRLSGRQSWQRLDDGEEVRGQRLNIFTASGFSMKQGEMRVTSRQLKGKESLDGEISLNEIELQPFAFFLAKMPLDKKIQDQLANLAPTGRLEQTRFTWRGKLAALEQYSLNSRFTSLGIQPVNGIPGFSGLSGNLKATESGGDLDIDSQNALLDLKGVLRWPVPADKLTGEIKWEMGNGRTDVKISNLAITNQHLNGAINASYRYDGKKGGYIDLNGKFGNVSGKYANFYYPLVLDKETLDWLDTSILNAHGENVNVVIKGYLDDFPYRNNKDGEFKVSARITDGQLDYADGWPKVEGMNLDLLFQGDRMDLAIDKGHIYGNQIIKANISIPVLDADHPVLLIQGELQSPANDAIKFVNTSPVNDAIDHFTDGMTASGSGKLQLDINLPIDNPDATKVKGSYTVSNGTLTGDAEFPPLERINGKLIFTESSLHAQNVNANIYGGPGQFSLEAGSGGLLKILATGRIDENGMRRTLSNHPVMQRLHGAADWRADINVRDNLTNITLQSQLVGISSSLPPPFSKAAVDSLLFRFESQQTNTNQQILSIGLGNIASMKLLRTKLNGVQTLERGEVNFGGAAQLPAQPGIFLNGKLAHLDWDLWSKLLERPIESAPDRMDHAEIAGANLDIGTLDVFGRRINELNFSYTNLADGWMTNLRSREITGGIRWQPDQGKGKILARLKSLAVPGPAPVKMGEADEASKDHEYPGLDIIADNFEASQKKLGRLELLANQQGINWNINKLIISNPDSTLTVDGIWDSWKRKPKTRLNATWDISDVGKTLDRLGYPDTVKGGTANITGKLNWPGSPDQFSLPSLGGNLELDAKSGQFLKVKSGVGRLLGVFMLDFRDVLNGGFAFDNIGGSMQIDRGVMKSKNFKMEGPAAKVAISGETDLDRETLNLHVIVSPKVSNSISLAAFAGGPVVGLAAFVAQKLLGDPLNKIAAYGYDIGGTWDDPQETKSVTEKKETPAPSPLGK